MRFTSRFRYTVIVQGAELQLGQNAKGHNLGTLSPITLKTIVLALVGFSAYTLFAGVPSEIEVRNTVELLLGQLDPQLFAKLTQSQQSSMFAILMVMPGLLGASWVALHILNIGIARRLFKSSAQNVHIRALPSCLPKTYVFMPLIAALMSFLSDPTWQYLGKNAFVILVAPLFFLGLKHIHENLDKMQNSRLGYFAFYFLLIAFTWSSVIIAFYGLLQHLKQFRVPPANGDICAASADRRRPCAQPTTNCPGPSWPRPSVGSEAEPSEISKGSRIHHTRPDD